MAVSCLRALALSTKRQKQCLHPLSLFFFIYKYIHIYIYYRYNYDITFVDSSCTHEGILRTHTHTP